MLYQSIVSVEEKSFSIQESMIEVERLLILDNTSKQYEMDLQMKFVKLLANNEKLH